MLTGEQTLLVAAAVLAAGLVYAGWKIGELTPEIKKIADNTDSVGDLANRLTGNTR
jgi:hypothetical protein